jgi:hypothetical protein
VSEPTPTEIRLRCIEAAAKSPIVHKDGPAAGVLATAQEWSTWVTTGQQKQGTLGLPKKP